MSKLTRQQLILQLIENGNVANQEDLRRGLARQGHQVTQATLSRILGRHPRLSRPLLFSRESGNSADLTEYYPHVLGNGQLRVHPFDWQKLGESKVDLLFLATPHETSREWAPEALKRGMRVIDLSGAWRLKQETHRAIYGFHDSDPALANTVAGKAVYGLPELRSKQISGSTLIAN